MKFKKERFQRLWQLLFIVLIAGGFSLSSCEDLIDDDNGDNGEDTNIEADAGENTSANVGQEVILDGTNSSADSEILSYMWEFAQKPAESEATIADPTAPNPKFVPDVEGEYIILFTVTTENGSDSDQVMVTVSAGSAQTEEVSGDINSDRTWTDHVDDPNNPDYLLTGHVSVNAKLTINPNVLIHVKEDVGLWVNQEGTIISNGEAGSEVIFTSENEAGGLKWRGIKIESSSALNTLAYTKIMYAGNSEFGFSGPDYVTAIGLEDGKVKLMNSVVSHSGGYGLFYHSGNIEAFSSNEFNNNMNYGLGVDAEQAGNLDSETSFSDANMAVEIYGSTLNSTSETKWPVLASGASYYASGTIEVNSHLEISPGAIILFAEDKAFSVKSEGTLIANAAESEKIILSSKNADAGVYWKGVYVSSNDSRNIFANVEVSYAGNSEWGFSGSNHPGAIGIEDGKLGLSNTTVMNSKAYGIYVKSGTFNEFNSNVFDSNTNTDIVLMANSVSKIDAATTFTNNGNWNGVMIYGSELTEEATWVNLKGEAKYQLSGDLNINAGLILKPGSDLGAKQDVMITVGKDGYLNAIGTAESMITFTTADIPGEILWAGIFIRSSHAMNVLDYVNIDYAGGREMPFSGPNRVTALGGDDSDSPKVELTNSSIKHSGGFAVYWEGGEINDIEAAGNTFTDNIEKPGIVLP